MGHIQGMLGALSDQHLVGHLCLSQHSGHLLAVNLQGSARARVGVDEQQELLAVVDVRFGCAWSGNVGCMGGAEGCGIMSILTIISSHFFLYILVYCAYQMTSKREAQNNFLQTQKSRSGWTRKQYNVPVMSQHLSEKKVM